MLYPHGYGENPLYPQSGDFEVIRKDDTSGFGVIARRAFKRGEVIAVMHGEVVPDIRQHTLQITPDQHLLDIHFAGYFLHSCSPNISLDMQAMTVTAIKNIPANSYLYMDYAQTEDVLFKQFACSCGSANCRGWITGRREMPLPLVADAVAEGVEAN